AVPADGGVDRRAIGVAGRGSEVIGDTQGGELQVALIDRHRGHLAIGWRRLDGVITPTGGGEQRDGYGGGQSGRQWHSRLAIQWGQQGDLSTRESSHTGSGRSCWTVSDCGRRM